MSKMEELLQQQEAIVAAIKVEYERGIVAAEKGDAEAKYNLAVLYYKGQGVKQNYLEAMRLFKVAAEQGNTDAKLNLGLMFYNGQGGPQDYAEAMHWYVLAAQADCAHAELTFGSGDYYLFCHDCGAT